MRCPLFLHDTHTQSTNRKLRSSPSDSRYLPHPPCEGLLQLLRPRRRRSQRCRRASVELRGGDQTSVAPLESLVRSLIFINFMIFQSMNIYHHVSKNNKHIWAPVNIVYMSVVAIVMGGPIVFRVLWKSAYARSNMKPKSIPKQAWKWIEELLC